ncbi:IS3 family transposase [Paenibacillus sp. FSL L8-0158]|uniref:IS3 family transposase n=1 Tax=Paenibacillus sp. FSL L8-0158 TaxID=2954752 RepID=UPI00315883CC
MEAVPKSKKFAVIQELLSKGHSIVLLCELAGVSKSGFYKWIKRKMFVSQKQREDETIKLKIMSCYEKLKGIYGYRRVKVWLNRIYGIHINHKRVRRLMGELGIKAIIRRKKPYYGKKEAYVISGNHLNREFKADQLNQKWVTDITYLIFNGQRLYLSAIQDLFNNEIVAYQISRRNDLSLVLDTVKKARKRQDARGVLLHSDQGFQYTSRQYTNLLKRYGIQASMSRKGNCWDNACIENFFSHFKTECFYLHAFHSAQQVEHAVQKYIHFYNHERFQEKLNNLTPYEYRTQAA